MCIKFVDINLEARPLTHHEIMTKLKIFFTFAIMAGCMMSASAEKPTSKARQAHAEAQKELLANQNKTKIDKESISNLIAHDVESRESSIAGLSPESARMIDDLLKEGNKHIGKRYVWGSKGPNTFDCSGFTSYVYKQFGYNLSPASRVQYTQGEVVADRKSLRKGDLVFFTSRRSGKNVGHVGIVVSADNETGNFKFIHASIRGVKISEYSEAYYTRTYVGAKRIITE